MKKFLLLIITMGLLATVICGCDKMPSQEEVDAARLTAISYASTAYEAITQEEWFDDSYTLIGVYSGGYNYASCKEPVKEYKSKLKIGEDTILINNTIEANWDFIFFFTNQENEIITCDVVFVGEHKATSVETGEIKEDSPQCINVAKPYTVEGADQNWIDENYTAERQNGYSVYAEEDVRFFLEANELQ